MFKELIDAILNGYDAKHLEVDGTTYTTKPIHIPPAEPLAKPIEVSTLTGFVDYIAYDIDGDAADLHIEIASPTRVLLRSRFDGRYKQRDTVILADCSDLLSTFPFRQYLPTDQAVIGIQAHFIDAEDRAALLSHVGTVLYESTLEVKDDGITQQTLNKSGIARRTEGGLRNPIALTPYRTFAEIAQPASQYIFRLKNSERDGIQFALFESGDQQWRLEAITGIKQELQRLLAEAQVEIPILA